MNGWLQIPKRRDIMIFCASSPPPLIHDATVMPQSCRNVHKSPRAHFPCCQNVHALVPIKALLAGLCGGSVAFFLRPSRNCSSRPPSVRPRSRSHSRPRPPSWSRSSSLSQSRSRSPLDACGCACCEAWLCAICIIIWYAASPLGWLDCCEPWLMADKIDCSWLSSNCDCCCCCGGGGGGGGAAGVPPFICCRIAI